MIKISKTLRENKDEISKIKENSFQNKLPFGILRDGENAIKSSKQKENLN